MSERLTGDIRREQIAKAALELAAAHGLRDLQVGAIARHLGLVPSAIYRHFRNKEEVLGAVMDLIENKLLENVDAVCRESADPLERLKLLLLRHAGMIRDNQGIPRVVFSESVFCGPPERRGRLHRLITDYLERVSGIIREGQREGRIRPSLDAGTAAVVFLGLIQPATILWQASGGVFDVMAHVERAWVVFRDGITSSSMGVPSVIR